MWGHIVFTRVHHTPSGDQQLRGGYSQVLRQLLGELGVRQVRDVVDLGCATGLSSLELLGALPGSRVTGVDLSPHFLAVGQHQQEQRQARGYWLSCVESCWCLTTLCPGRGRGNGTADVCACCSGKHRSCGCECRPRVAVLGLPRTATTCHP
ncbi:MAG: methyltransferase domain-containing protein [Actinobacteria bacterium]|nr:methyltransferase domain-containing protein [Actinomycetota bacterium]